VQPKAAKAKIPGPAKQTSKFDATPEYQEFRTADKALKALLKAEKCDLKSLEGSLALPDAKRQVLETFHAKRDLFFRAKAALQPSNTPTSSSSLSATTPLPASARSGGKAPQTGSA